MPHNFILQCITISIRTLSNYVREKKNIKQKKQSFVPGGTSTRYKCPAATSEGRWHICTGPRLHPVQMWGICTEYLARYKCSTTFVPDGLYRLDTQYKCGLPTGTDALFSGSVPLDGDRAGGLGGRALGLPLFGSQVWEEGDEMWVEEYQEVMRWGSHGGWFSRYF
jgi:hypothetical protein